MRHLISKIKWQLAEYISSQFEQKLVSIEQVLLYLRHSRKAPLLAPYSPEFHCVP